jgi:hypothetical protein
MEAWLRQGELPSDAEARELLENLALDTLLDLAGDAGKALLRGLTLFDLPEPVTIVTKLESLLGGSQQHPRDLGPVDVFADMVDPYQPCTR